MTKKNKVLLIVTGSVGAYKAVEILRTLKDLNIDVKVILTEGAEKFISALTFSSSGAEEVFTEQDQFSVDSEGVSAHISLSRWADCILVAPATANTIAKILAGIADSLVLSTILASKKQIFIAPCMNTNMFENLITQRNINALKEHGVIFIGPEEGKLADFSVGMGRLTDPEKITQFVASFMHKDTELFKGKRFVVTAGPTREYLDPIRFITNDSSGKMGTEIAKEAKRMGGYVHLICGPSSVDVIGLDKIDKITTTEELFKKTKKAMERSDILIMAAAPADFKPEIEQPGKIQKISQLNVQFRKTVDIIKKIGQHKNNKIIVGFALQTEDIEKNAVKKMREKNMDIVIANSNLNIGQDFGSVLMIDKTGRKKVIRNETKQKIAREILIFLKEFLKKERRNG